MSDTRQHHYTTVQELGWQISPLSLSGWNEGFVDNKDIDPSGAEEDYFTLDSSTQHGHIKLTHGEVQRRMHQERRLMRGQQMSMCSSQSSYTTTATSPDKSVDSDDRRAQTDIRISMTPHIEECSDSFQTSEEITIKTEHATNVPVQRRTLKARKLPPQRPRPDLPPIEVPYYVQPLALDSPLFDAIRPTLPLRINKISRSSSQTSAPSPSLASSQASSASSQGWNRLESPSKSSNYRDHQRKESDVALCHGKSPPLLPPPSGPHPLAPVNVTFTEIYRPCPPPAFSPSHPFAFSTSKALPALPPASRTERAPICCPPTLATGRRRVETTQQLPSYFSSDESDDEDDVRSGQSTREVSTIPS